MFGFVTPREAMAFSARLRLPASTSKETITGMVNRMVQRLGLEGCARTAYTISWHSSVEALQQHRTTFASLSL